MVAVELSTHVLKAMNFIPDEGSGPETKNGFRVALSVRQLHTVHNTEIGYPVHQGKDALCLA